MTSANRRPLTIRPSQSLPNAFSPVCHLKSQLPKRPRSPDSAVHNLGSLIKRHKPTTTVALQNISRKDRKLDHVKPKDLQKAEREQQRLEFKEKYCRAFPNWIFHFDTESLENEHQLESFQSRIQQLGAITEPFFSRETTHLISNRPVPSQSNNSEKENAFKGRVTSKPVQHLRSPVKMRLRQQEDQEPTDLIGNALKFNIKIWNTAKLESVLARCLEEPINPIASISSNSKQRNPNNLSKLLQSERIHGLSERDPTQKRHDFHYFTRGSYFVLIEDIHGELATIATHEYPSYKERDGEKPPWPTLYCHPHARGPFIPFDGREKRRWERLQQAEEKDNEQKRIRYESFFKKHLMEKRPEMDLRVRKGGDLRRSVSMNNMRNARVLENPLLEHDGEGDAIESANPSGYLGSGFAGYVAASGNSVGITSTTGTTSFASYTSRNLQVPLNLSGRAREVVMRKQPQERLARAKTMAPPADIPSRTLALRKSKSTTTLKLPKREEGSKPGYCESCRQKFEDFKEHIQGRRHRKFAEDSSNFRQLDDILARVQRRTLMELQTLNQQRFGICRLKTEQGHFDFDRIPIES